jgi:hypothetical protein
MIDGHRKGIYARGVPHSKSFLGRNGERAPERSAGQVLGAIEALAKRRGQINQRAPESRGEGRGWPELLTPAQISTSSSNFAALLQNTVALPPQRSGADFLARLGAKIPDLP